MSVDEDSFFNDAGEWTENGVAVLGTYIQEIEIYKNALDDVNEELANFKQLSFDSEQEEYDKLTELTEKQHEYASAVSDAEQSVVEMYESQIDAIEEYTDTLVDAYNDYIDVVKETLDAERDLYEFRKNIQKQSKDIATLERRIASLSGSDSAADIAERRKLEAELYEAKEGLNDTYYDHAKDQQNQALDDESEAYAESMENYIESLRDTLKEAQTNMDSFMQKVTSAVMLNAGVIEKKYDETGILISEDLTTPWSKAQAAMKDYEVDGLSLMNEWTKEGGIFYNFDTQATSYVESPWKAGEEAVNAFQSAVTTAMEGVVADVESNVAKAKGDLAELYADIVATEKKINNVNGNVTFTVNDTYSTGTPNTGVVVTAPTQTTSDKGAGYLTQETKVIMSPIYVDSAGAEYYKISGWSDRYVKKGSTTNKSGTLYAIEGAYYYTAAQKNLKKKTTAGNGKVNAGNNQTHSMYASGTTGTSKDEWAITDEPWIGDELTMYATKQGTLSYMRAGSTVIPADLTKELMAIGEVGLKGLINMPKFNSGVGLISNIINKPELNISFDALVKAEKITEETLPAVKKLVTQELDKFTRQLNYALKRS